MFNSIEEADAEYRRLGEEALALEQRRAEINKWIGLQNAPQGLGPGALIEVDYAGFRAKRVRYQVLEVLYWSKYDKRLTAQLIKKNGKLGVQRWLSNYHLINLEIVTPAPAAQEEAHAI
jgi:hypothetical protein